MSTTIRVTDETKQKLATLARQLGRPMTEVVDEALDQLERRVFFETVAARYQELRSDPEVWAAIETERGDWDATLLDGLG